MTMQAAHSNRQEAAPEPSEACLPMRHSESNPPMTPPALRSLVVVSAVFLADKFCVAKANFGARRVARQRVRRTTPAAYSSPPAWPAPGWRVALAACGFLGILGMSPLCAAETAALEQAPATSRELARVQNLIRANVLELAQEILETQGPAWQPTMAWLHWERQLWALYRVQGAWRKLHWRAQWLPSSFPQAMRREADLRVIEALTALGRNGEARRLIRQNLLASTTPSRHQRQLRRALIVAYLADDMSADARFAMDNFHQDYGAEDSAWLLLSASVLLRSGDAEAAINLLAALNQPAARLLRLYARLSNRTLTPPQAIERAGQLLLAPRGAAKRDIWAVIAQAHRIGVTEGAGVLEGHALALSDAIENYLLAPPSNPVAGSVYPSFTVRDLFDAYATIARDEANQAALLVGEDAQWLDLALKLPPNSVPGKALFAHLAAAADRRRAPRFRQRAVDGYIEALIATERTALIEQVFSAAGLAGAQDGDPSGEPLGADRNRQTAILGKLTLGGETGLRLSAHAIESGDIRLAADANAHLRALPAGVDRAQWLLQAGRIDIFAGRHRLGAAKLDEWLDSFRRLDEAQTDAVLQPIFDLQTARQHALALDLLHKVSARAPPGKHQREIPYWLGESYGGDGQHVAAADAFLHSALQQADGFDRWGEAARFRAAEALMNGQLFADARRLFDDILARADSAARRTALQQKIQRSWLLESISQSENSAP